MCESDDIKTFRSPGYNYNFNRIDGRFERWGRTVADEDDPVMAPAPEILDIEISTICHQGCEFCYKTNGAVGKNMSLETFKKIFECFPESLTQIAFGIGDIDGNPEMFDIMQHCRDNDVVPNVTINGSRMTDEYYESLAELCGAVSVSNYCEDQCYDAVQNLSSYGIDQVNIHQLLSKETWSECFKVMNDAHADERLEGLNAIVYLWLKPKGDRNTMTPITDTEYYRILVEALLASNTRFGFDSCSANNFEQVLPSARNDLKQYIEPCESSLFSYYIDVDGVAWPCSFCEGIGEGVNLLQQTSFWNSDPAQNFREKLLANNRSCPVYDLELM